MSFKWTWPFHINIESKLDSPAAIVNIVGFVCLLILALFLFDHGIIFMGSLSAIIMMIEIIFCFYSILAAEKQNPIINNLSKHSNNKKPNQKM